MGFCFPPFISPSFIRLCVYAFASIPIREFPLLSSNLGLSECCMSKPNFILTEIASIF